MDEGFGCLAGLGILVLCCALSFAIVMYAGHHWPAQVVSIEGSP